MALTAHKKGSSPLTRGKPPGRPPGEVGGGLIPAHAGKTGPPGTLTCPPRAHPRSRGENRDSHATGQIAMGSSPLTRGKPAFRCSDVSALGLIPAHAGKTSSLTTLPLRRGAHPRSRGENPLEINYFESCVGLIPAHAGKTEGSLACLLRAAAHPRSRGENAKIEIGRVIARGSSPLTRGKRSTSVHVRYAIGLIPAHAGKTTIVKLPEIGVRAHPRSRGENQPTPCLRE